MVLLCRNNATIKSEPGQTLGLTHWPVIRPDPAKVVDLVTGFHLCVILVQQKTSHHQSHTTCKYWRTLYDHTTDTDIDIYWHSCGLKLNNMIQWGCLAPHEAASWKNWTPPLSNPSSKLCHWINPTESTWWIKEHKWSYWPFVEAQWGRIRQEMQRRLQHRSVQPVVPGWTWPDRCETCTELHRRRTGDLRQRPPRLPPQERLHTDHKHVHRIHHGTEYLACAEVVTGCQLNLPQRKQKKAQGNELN